MAQIANFDLLYLFTVSLFAGNLQCFFEINGQIEIFSGSWNIFHIFFHN